MAIPGITKKIKLPEPPPTPVSAYDKMPIQSSKTQQNYTSYISTSNNGLIKRAATTKKSLLGGV